MDWKSMVKSVAPYLGSALAGPKGGLAVKFIAEKLLGDKDANESDVAEYILESSPEDLIQLRTIDADFKTKMRELEIDVFRLEVQDRDSARLNHKDAKTPSILVYILTGLVSAMILGLFFLPIPDQNKNTLYMIAGQIMTAWAAALAYWYGTTKNDSDNKKLFTPVR